MARRILIIEDAPGTQAVLDAVLQHAGYEVCLAATGAEALACLEQQPDAIVLSSHLPDMSSLDLLTTIKARSATPIMVITADNAAQHEAEIRASADVALARPLNLRLLFKQLGALLESAPPRSKAASSKASAAKRSSYGSERAAPAPTAAAEGRGRGRLAPAATADGAPPPGKGASRKQASRQGESAPPTSSRPASDDSRKQASHARQASDESRKRASRARRPGSSPR